MLVVARLTAAPTHFSDGMQRTERVPVFCASISHLTNRNNLSVTNLPALPPRACQAPLALSPNEKWFVHSTGSQRARVWDVESGKALHELSHLGEVNAVAISRDGEWIAAGADDELAHVWSTSTGQPVFPIPGSGDLRRAPGFSQVNPTSACRCLLNPYSPPVKFCRSVGVQ